MFYYNEKGGLCKVLPSYPSINLRNVVEDKFIELYEKNSDPVFRYCVLRIADREIAVELTQEAFTKYWDELTKGKKIENARALLFRIIHNLVIDWYRKKKSISLEALAEASETDTEEFIRPEDGAKIDLEMETESRFLLEKINNLSKSYRQAIYLKYVEGMDNSEIAKVLGIKESAAAVRVHRGIEELKKITDYK